MGIGEDDRIGGSEPVQIAAALHQSFWSLAISRSFLCNRLIEAHQRSAAAMPEKNHLRDAGLTACEIDRRLYIERYVLPPDRRFIVLESRVETERKEAARGQFTAAYVVQIIRRAMSEDEGDMGCRPAVGLVQRGAQLPEANIFRMALREASTASSHCGGCKYRNPWVWRPFHLSSSLPFIGALKIRSSIRLFEQAFAHGHALRGLARSIGRHSWCVNEMRLKV